MSTSEPVRISERYDALNQLGTYRVTIDCEDQEEKEHQCSSAPFPFPLTRKRFSPLRLADRHLGIGVRAHPSF